MEQLLKSLISVFMSYMLFNYILLQFNINISNLTYTIISFLISLPAIIELSFYTKKSNRIMWYNG